MILVSKGERQRQEQTIQINEIYRQKLLGYAESFRQLANSFEGEFVAKGEDRQSLLEEKNHWENQKVINDNLKEMAQIMSRMAKEDLRCEPMEVRYQRMLTRALREENIFVENLCYLPCNNGQKGIVMTLFTTEKGGIPTTEVEDMLSVLLRRPLQASVVSPYLIDRQSRNFLFVEEAKYIALTGFSKVVRENEIVSGDNYAFLESEKGKLTIILSDGTGSGEKAGRDSGKVLDLMEKMLEAGYRVESAVKLVNSTLYAKAEDNNHPTIDICNLDLYRGTCEFTKVGGTLSFLKRGNKVEVIEIPNLPMGIFQNIDIQTYEKQLQDGDFIIMMSDGVLGAFQEDEYLEILTNTIEEITDQNPSEIAEKLLHFAIHFCGGHILDDMTIIVAGLWEKSTLT